MELINKDTPQVKEFISSLDSMLDGIESIVKHYKPHLNIYRQSDIDKLLQKHYFESWKE